MPQLLMELLVELVQLDVVLVLLHHNVLLVILLYLIWLLDHVFALMENISKPVLLLPLPTPQPSHLTQPPLLLLLLTLPQREFYKHHVKIVQNHVLNVVQLPYVQSVHLDILLDPLITLAKLTLLLSLASTTSL